MHDRSEFEKAYSSSEVSGVLQIASSTLRKWCLILEDHGYAFIRDDQDRRLFTDSDVIALTAFKDLTQGKSVGLNSAASVVVSKYSSRGAPQNVTTLDTRLYPRHDTRYDDLFSLVHDLKKDNELQKEFNKSLLERFEQQKSYIETSLKNRDELLISSLRKELDMVKRVTAEKEKRGLLRRLLRRK